MAYSLTPWGYEVDGDLPPLVSSEEFALATGDRWQGDPRADAAVAAATLAVRNACNWHVGPSVQCRATVDVLDCTRSLWLPARNVTSVISVTDANGNAITGWQWSRIGQMLFDSPLPRGLRAVTVEYEAGTDTADLAALVAGVASRTLALRPGVTSESAGGVSVSVSAGIAAASAAPFLTDAERGVMAPYKAVRAHAT